MTLQVMDVEVRAGYQLRVQFDNGETRMFDLRPYLNKGVFTELRDESYVKKVRPVSGGIEWPHQQDLSSDTLYYRGTPI